MEGKANAEETYTLLALLFFKQGNLAFQEFCLGIIVVL